MTSRFSSFSWLGVALFVVGLVACASRPLERLQPCTITSAAGSVPVRTVDKVDLLFVIDNSDSMAEEQVKVKEQLPRMINTLLDGGEGGANTYDVSAFPAVKSLRVGIITTDVGISGNSGGLGGCTEQGEDAKLRTQDGAKSCTVPSAAGTAREGTLQYDDPADKVAFDAGVDCVTKVGGGGCGYEQQLKAIDRFNATEDLLVANSASVNSRFYRDDALLAIFLVTDENDCTTEAGNIFTFPGSSPATFQPELVCYKNRNQLTSPATLAASAMAHAKAAGKDPSNIVFAAITGVPNAETLAAAYPSATDPNRTVDLNSFASLLTHPLMVDVPNTATDAGNHPSRTSTVDVTEGTPPVTRTMMKMVQDEEGSMNQTLVRVTPACWNSAGRAFAGRRIVELAQGIDKAGASVVVSSICDASFQSAVVAVVNEIAEALRRLCLPRSLNANSRGLVPCTIVELQPAGVTSCNTANGRVPVSGNPIDRETGRTNCEVTQLPTSGTTEPTAPGWFYDNFSADTSRDCAFRDLPGTPDPIRNRQRVRFTAGFEPPGGSTIRFECPAPIPPASKDRGFPCGADTDCQGPDLARTLGSEYDYDYCPDDIDDRCAAQPLHCDGGAPSGVGTSTCQLSCADQGDCPRGFSCLTVDPGDPAFPPIQRPICVVATCSSF